MLSLWAACHRGQSKQDSSRDVKCAPKAGGLPSSQPQLTAAAAAAAQHSRDGSVPQVAALGSPWGSSMRSFGMGRDAGKRSWRSGEALVSNTYQSRGACRGRAAPRVSGSPVQPKSCCEIVLLLGSYQNKWGLAGAWANSHSKRRTPTPLKGQAQALLYFKHMRKSC